MTSKICVGCCLGDTEWHIGHLNRIPGLLISLLDIPRNILSVNSDFPNYQGVNTSLLISTAKKIGWIREDQFATLMVTDKGKKIVEIEKSNPQKRLQIQIQHMIEELLPKWGATIIQGRKAFFNYAPLEVVQCFSEANLFDTYDLDALRLWDTLASLYRKDKDLNNVIIGREGEYLSYCYEKKRTGETPRWISLEYEGLGYDILSRRSSTLAEKLLIEVKTSKQAWDNAVFHLTRNEWNILSNSDCALVHLWSISQSPPLFSIISIEDLRPHVPLDQGNGQWSDMECKFSFFPPK